MHLRNLFCLTLIIFLMTFPPFANAEGLGIIVISGAEIEPIPTAIPPLKLTGNVRIPPGSKFQPHVEIANILRSDLEVAAEFEILDQRGFLEDPQLAPLVPDSNSFADWYMVGAELLIKGQIDREGSQLIVDLYAYDVFQRKFLVGKRYRGDETTIRPIAHMFANALMDQLTGKPGPFGTEIVFAVRDGKKKNLASAEPSGDNFRMLTHNKSLNLNPVWSRDGESVYLTSYYGGDPDICRYHIPTEQLRYVYKGMGSDMPGQESPDGKTLLFAASYNGNMDIYTMDLKSRKTRRQTRNRSIDVSPSFSPDGKQIVFVSDRKGNPNLFIMDLNGDRARRITFVGNHNGDPAWSPDGKKIAYSSMDSKAVFQVYIVDPAGKKAIPITSGRYDTYEPSWSPDSRFLAVTSKKDGIESVFVLRLGINNRLWRVSPTGREASQPYWSHGPVVQ